MASPAKIKAGEAYWEATIRDKTGAALARVQAKLKAFGSVTKSLAGSLNAVGTRIAAIGAVGLAGFGSAIREFMDLPKRAKELGAALSGIDVTKSERLTKSFETLSATFSALKFVIGAGVAEPLAAAMDRVSALLVMFAKFAAANPMLVQTLLAVSAGAAVVGAALVGVGTVLAGVGAAMSGLSTAAGVLGPAMAFLATPFGMVVAGLTAVGAAIVAVRLNWEAVMRAMISATAEMVATVGVLLKSMERDFGIDLGSKSFDSWSKDIRGMMKLFPTITADRAVVPQIQQFQGVGNIGSGIGSQRGTFFGGRAENLAIGAGGGAEDRRHRELRERLDEEIRVLRDIFGAVKNNEGPVFQ